MPGKMDKKDVKLAFKDAKAVNWTHVQQCSGVSIPSIAKQSVKDALENKKYKKLTVKIGLIKKDLYLRIKNGNDHVQDVKLVPNWTPPKGWVQGEVAVDDDEGTEENGEQKEDQQEEEEEDPNYQKNLTAWKEGKENARKTGESVAKSIQQFLDGALDLAERAEIAADQVSVGQGATDGFGNNLAVKSATELLEQVNDLRQKAEDEYQRYFIVYDVHRKGEKGEAFKKEDREGYGMPFFMQVLKPLDQKCNALKSSLAAAVTKTQTAVNQIAAYQQNGKTAAFLLKAESCRLQADELLQRSKNILGGMTGDIEKMVTKGSGLFMDLANLINEKTHDLKLAHADKALQRLTQIREASPRMEEILKEYKVLSASIVKIPKDLAKDIQIKAEIEGFARIYKAAVLYHTQWHKHEVTAENTYKEILKRVNE